VEEGETFEQGALREAYEETGLQNLVVAVYLGTMETYFDGTHRRVIKDAELFDVPNGRSMGKTLERGNRVLFHKEQDGHAYVTHDKEHDPYFPYPSISGWVHAEAVQPHRLERQFFHLATATPPRDQWEHLAEGQYPFRFFWVNVNADPHLATTQQAWWDAVIEKLR
jgi:8-oxo-dGTP pyrophosphatase MutT (NUDIX family)